MFKKIVTILTLIIALPVASFAQDSIGLGHIISIRGGVSFDQSYGKVDYLEIHQLELSRMGASFNFLMNYDLLVLPVLSIGPEFSYTLPRKLSSNSFDDEFTIKWHELKTGLMMKFTLLGLVYMGYGLGMGYSFGASSEEVGLANIENSFYPYLALELGGNFILSEISQGPRIAANIALRGESNIALWKDPLANNRMQNRFNVGLILGMSILWVNMDWL